MGATAVETRFPDGTALVSSETCSNKSNGINRASPDASIWQQIMSVRNRLVKSGKKIFEGLLRRHHLEARSRCCRGQ